jgi:hypothetical protein
MEYQPSNQTNTQLGSSEIDAFVAKAGKNKEQIKDFLQLLYGKRGTEGYLVLFTKDGKRSYFYALDDLDEAASKAASLSETHDVYFGVGLQKERLESDRGKAETVATIPGLWLDVDVQGPNHSSQELPLDVKSARSVLDSCPLKPSMILFTGGGLHAYWLFREPLVIRNEANLAKAKALSRKFQEVFLDAASNFGWKIDNTSSLAQVLRLPGTYNHKQGVPVPVKVIESNRDNRYAPAEIEAWLENASPIFGGHRDI